MKISELPSIDEIIELRKSMGITQPQLANAVGIARGTIARMESKKYFPKYSDIQRIFEYLYSKKNIPKKPLYEFGTRKIFSVKPNQTIDKALELILKHEIDCVPVIEGNIVKGKITTRKLATRKTNKEDSKIKSSEFMEEPPPVVSYNTPGIYVKQFLKSSTDCVILSKKGELYGLVTPWDFQNAE
ncbi:MAG: CBS domain-containing protein [Nitrososphaeraceae archaeon]